MATFIRIIGWIFLLGGAALFAYGIHSTGNPEDQYLEYVVGHYTKEVLWLIIGGLAALSFGGALIYIGRQLS